MFHYICCQFKTTYHHHVRIDFIAGFDEQCKNLDSNTKTFLHCEFSHFVFRSACFYKLAQEFRRKSQVKGILVRHISLWQEVKQADRRDSLLNQKKNSQVSCLLQKTQKTSKCFQLSGLVFCCCLFVCFIIVINLPPENHMNIFWADLGKVKACILGIINHVFQVSKHCHTSEFYKTQSVIKLLKCSSVHMLLLMLFG